MNSKYYVLGEKCLLKQFILKKKNKIFITI